MTLGTKLALATSAAILAIASAFFGYNYREETRLLTDQLHEHMGENVATLTSCLRGGDAASDMQAMLEGLDRGFDRHIEEYGHEPRPPHFIAVLAPDGAVLASTAVRWQGRPLPPELRGLAEHHAHLGAARFEPILFEETLFLFLAQPLPAGRTLLYLEPYATVTRLAGRALARNLAFCLTLACVLALAVNLLTRRLVTRRLGLLARAMEREELSPGAGAEIPPMGSDELGEVRDVYARTRAELRRSRLLLEEHARTLEQQVRERTEQLVRATRLAAVGELAAGVAHGLNNPLASAGASAEKLLDLQERAPAELERRLPEHLRRILRNIDRCRRITLGLLSFAREKPFEPVLVQPSAILRESLSVIEAEAEARGIELKSVLAASAVGLRTDPEALTQALLNLFSNALAASPAGSVVEVGVLLEEAELVFYVQDQGPGVAPEDRERIFQPFYTTKPPEQGTGLGLPVCQALVDRMGGRIVLKSEPGHGARFEIRVKGEAS